MGIIAHNTHYDTFSKLLLSILMIMSISGCGLKGPLIEIQKAEIF